MLSQFNSNLPSSLDPERIEQINKLGRQAHIAANYKPTGEPSYIDDLIIETCAMQDVLEEISEAGTFIGFYENIDSAFELLIERRQDKAPKVFETYRQLTGILRVIEREKSVINQKWQEATKLLDDINTLDSEDVSRRKGGIDHVK